MIAIFPEIATCASSGNVEELAILVRRYFGGNQTFAPRISVSNIMKGVGIQVRELPFDQHAALLGKDEKGRFEIVAVVSETLDPITVRFTLAHLLGHYLFDMQPLIARGEWQVSGFREMVCPLKRYSLGSMTSGGVAGFELKEQRADNFAAALLLPKAMLKKALGKLLDEDRTATFFGVNRATVLRRLQQIGERPDDPVNFLDAERKLGGSHDADPPSNAVGTQSSGNAILKSPVAIGSVSRSLAATTYGKQGGGDSAANVSAPSERESRVSHPKGQAGKSVLKGMDRIRQLAHMIDKGSPT